MWILIFILQPTSCIILNTSWASVSSPVKWGNEAKKVLMFVRHRRFINFEFQARRGPSSHLHYSHGKAARLQLSPPPLHAQSAYRLHQLLLWLTCMLKKFLTSRHAARLHLVLWGLPDATKSGDISGLTWHPRTCNLEVWGHMLPGGNWTHGSWESTHKFSSFPLTAWTVWRCDELRCPL